MNDQPLYDAVAAGLMRAEEQMAKLGVGHWKVAMVAYDPDNPRAYVVLGSAGEEEVQKKLGLVINPEDGTRQHDYVAPKPVQDDVPPRGQRINEAAQARFAEKKGWDRPRPFTPKCPVCGRKGPCRSHRPS